MTRERPAAGDAAQDSTDDGVFPSQRNKPTRNTPIAVANRGNIRYNPNLVGDTLSGTYLLPSGIAANDYQATTRDTYGTAKTTLTLSPGLPVRGQSYELFNAVIQSPVTTTTFTVNGNINNLSPSPNRQYWYIYGGNVAGPTDSLLSFSKQISLLSGKADIVQLQLQDIAGIEMFRHGKNNVYGALPTMSPTNLQLSMYASNISTTFDGTFLLDVEINTHRDNIVRL